MTADERITSMGFVMPVVVDEDGNKIDVWGEIVKRSSSFEEAWWNLLVIKSKLPKGEK